MYNGGRRRARVHVLDPNLTGGERRTPNDACRDQYPLVAPTSEAHASGVTFLTIYCLGVLLDVRQGPSLEGYGPFQLHPIAEDRIDQ